MPSTYPETKFIQLPGSRRLAFCEYGDQQGAPVFYFHGTPGSRLEAQLGARMARKYRIRILAPDRPGIGRSDPRPGRKLLD